jgi:hypothetical protein
MENAMRCIRKGVIKVIAVAALLGGLFLFSDSKDANAQAMGGHGWMPAAQTSAVAALLGGLPLFSGSKDASAQGQAWREHGPGYGQGRYATTQGNAEVNTAAGYHNGHGPHSGPYQGCGW